MAGAAAVPLAITRRRIAISATAALAGVVLSVLGEPGMGGWVTVLSVVGLIWNLHRFGRSGAD